MSFWRWLELIRDGQLPIPVFTWLGWRYGIEFYVWWQESRLILNQGLSPWTAKHVKTLLDAARQAFVSRCISFSLDAPDVLDA